MTAIHYCSSREAIEAGMIVADQESRSVVDRSDQEQSDYWVGMVNGNTLVGGEKKLACVP